MGAVQSVYAKARICNQFKLVFFKKLNNFPFKAAMLEKFHQNFIDLHSGSQKNSGHDKIENVDDANLLNLLPVCLSGNHLFVSFIKGFALQL